MKTRLIAAVLLASLPALAHAQSDRASLPNRLKAAETRLDAIEAAGSDGSAQAGFAQAQGATVFSVLSAEMMTNPNFTSDLSGWTGANWAFSSGRALHSAGSVEALSQSVSVVSGTWYQIAVNFPAGVVGTAGSISIALGAQSVRATVINPGSSSQATSEWLVIQANVTGSVALTATPTTDFNGALDSFSMKAFVGEMPVVFDMRDTAGVSFAPVRGNPDFPSSSNIFWGFDAGRYALGDGETVAIGQLALRHVGNPGFGGYRNTMVGAYAGMNITNGIENVAVGGNAMQQNTNGIRNTAVGRQAMWTLRTGDYNTAFGYGAGLSMIYGNWNTLLGTGAGQSVSATAAVPTGAYSNTLVGVNAGFNFGGVAGQSVTTASYATVVGASSGFCSSTQRVNASVFGSLACVDSDNTVVLGNTSVTSVLLGGNTGAATGTATRFRSGDGTKALPAFSFTSATSYGLYMDTSRMNVSSGGNFQARFDNGVAVPSTLQFMFLSGTAESNSPDAGFARVSAGLIRASDASTGSGQFIARTRIVAITGTGNASATDSGSVYTNEGDGDGAIVNLPDNPSYGQQFEAACVAAQNFDIKPASGESIQDAGSNGTTQIRCSAVGAYIRLVAVTSGSGAKWFVAAKNGTWTLS